MEQGEVFGPVREKYGTRKACPADENVVGRRRPNRRREHQRHCQTGHKNHRTAHEINYTTGADQVPSPGDIAARWRTRTMRR